MGNKIFIVFSILASFAVTGCLRTYYPAIQLSSAPPIIYNSSSSSEQSSKFISADLLYSNGIHEHETLNMVRGAYTITDTKDYFNFNARGFGYTGFYNVSGVNEFYDGGKNFLGVGTDVTISGNFKINKLKFGAGINLGLGIEFGEYYNYRIDASRAGLISKNNNLLFGMFSFFPVVSYEFSESSILSAQFNVGIPGLLSPIISLHNSGFIYWLGWMPDRDNNRRYYGNRITAGFMMNLNKFYPAPNLNL